MGKLLTMTKVKPARDLICTYLPGGQDGEVAYDEEGEASS
jgi:hypothetical protein